MNGRNLVQIGRMILLVISLLVVGLNVYSVVYKSAYASGEEGFRISACTYGLGSCNVIGYSCILGGGSCGSESCPPVRCNPSPE